MEVDTQSGPASTAFGLCSLQQHPAYARCLEQLGCRTETVTIRDRTNQIARAQIIRRRFGPLNIGWMAQGPVFKSELTPQQTEDCFASIFKAAPGWVVVTSDHQELAAAPGRRGTFDVGKPRQVAELDLTVSPDERLSAQSCKWRNRLRHAQKSCLHVHHALLDLKRDSALLSREFRQRRAKGYRALPMRFLEAWCRANPGAAHLFRAQTGREVDAFILVLLHHPTATYHLGWTGPEGRASSAHNLLLWDASGWLADQGYLRFDLGLAASATAPGLARFKFGSGAELRSLGKTYLVAPFRIPTRVRQLPDLLRIT